MLNKRLTFQNLCNAVIMFYDDLVRSNLGGWIINIQHRLSSTVIVQNSDKQSEVCNSPMVCK